MFTDVFRYVIRPSSGWWYTDKIAVKCVTITLRY